MAPDASTMKKPAAAATTLKRSATQQPAKGILKIPAAQSTRKRRWRTRKRAKEKRRSHLKMMKKSCPS